MKRDLSILVLNSPIYSLNERIFLDKHIQILKKLCKEIFVITGNYPARYSEGVRVIELEKGRKRVKKPSTFVRIADHVVAQIKLTLYLLKLSKNVGLVLFDIGEYRNILPVLGSKLLKKETVVFHRGGNKSLESRIENQSTQEKIIPPIQDCLMRMCYLLVDHILVESLSIIEFGELQRYRNKILVYGGDYIDFQRFQLRNLPSDRDAIVGYIGRLSPKKGVINLVKAMPLVSKKNENVRFVITGSGEQKYDLSEEVRRIGFKEKTTFISWLPDEDLPKYLNELKLFVLPSFEEGLPMTLIEAMACGAIVLSTPVGGIPDLLKDGKTGFILRDNTPSCVAEGILKALNNPYLDNMALAAKTMVETECSYEASVRRWKSVFAEILLEEKREPGAR